MSKNDRGFDPKELDRHITGNYGEDQYKNERDQFRNELGDDCLYCQKEIEKGQSYFTAENGAIHESCLIESGEVSDEDTVIDDDTILED